MTKKVGTVLALGLVAATGAATASQASEGGSAALCAPITVRVWDRLPVESQTLKRAKTVAERVFRGSGIDLAWLDCVVERDPTCATPAGPHEISLRIFRRPAAERRRTGDATGGMAVRQAGGGGIVQVFYDRLEEVTASRRVPMELVLGITATHEIGHLLLRRGHSASGIMRENLEGMDWHRAAQGWLSFKPGEMQVMRDAVCGSRGTQEEQPEQAVR